MTSSLKQISIEAAKAAISISLGALAYSQIKKLSIDNMKIKIKSFVQNQSLQYQKKYVAPKKIILISSQESEIEMDQSILNSIPNHEISLTENGIMRSSKIGQEIQNLLEQSSHNNKNKNIKVSSYCSPYTRAKQTFEEIKKSIKQQLIAIHDLNLRDQDLGNLPKNITSEEVQSERNLISPFFYRYDDGESEADVYLRTAAFTNTIIRELNNYDRNISYETQEKIIIVVAHPLIVSQLEQSLKKFDQDDNLLDIMVYDQ